MENLTDPEARGPRIAAAACFEQASYEPGHIAVAAFITEPDISLVTTKSPNIPIVVSGKTFIISGQDFAKLAQSDGGAITGVGAIHIIVAEEELEPITEEPAIIQHFNLHYSFLWL
ncbi:hypothetical protein ASG50_00775 [Rhizobium sp. Leaf386]|nr:hypothetical protein ASG50_00775 [Rhizobium sp. Leaf386]